MVSPGVSGSITSFWIADAGIGKAPMKSSTRAGIPVLNAEKKATSGSLIRVSRTCSRHSPPRRAS